jgi:hypothetical protein
VGEECVDRGISRSENAMCYLSHNGCCTADEVCLFLFYFISCYALHTPTSMCSKIYLEALEVAVVACKLVQRMEKIRICGYA